MIRILINADNYTFNELWLHLIEVLVTDFSLIKKFSVSK